MPGESGKPVAVVTGGARGIGAEIARRLAGGGATVVCADILDTAEIVEQINGDGGWVQFRNEIPSEQPLLVWFWAPH